MASTGTRLRFASNSPLIRCRLPGPQLPAHTASSPVSAASAAAANPAASSCRTCSQVISPSRRSASVNPLSESPGSPYTRRTPDAFSVATMTSATVVVILSLLRCRRSGLRGRGHVGGAGAGERDGLDDLVVEVLGHAFGQGGLLEGEVVVDGVVGGRGGLVVAD